MLGSPQGRIGAFNGADLAKGYELLRERFAFSTNFKTVLQYGQQPMTTSETSWEMLDLFLGVARPQLMEGPQDPLFISLTGTPLRFGRLVTDFFKRITDLHISVTTIRSVVATGAASLRGNGIITIEDLEGVSNTSGHSGATVLKYYKKQDRKRDMVNATEVHRKLLKPAHEHLDSSAENVFHAPLRATAAANNDRRAPPNWTQPQPQPLLSATADTESPVRATAAANNNNRRAPPNWTLTHPVTVSVATSCVGLKHPSFAESGRHITWTDTEIHIIGTWCSRYMAQHPGNNQIVAGCLKYILNDNEVRQHFHPHHVMDSARLRWGWQKYQEEQESSSLDLL